MEMNRYECKAIHRNAELLLQTSSLNGANLMKPIILMFLFYEMSD